MINLPNNYTEEKTFPIIYYLNDYAENFYN